MRDSVSSFIFLAGTRSAELGERWARDVIALTRVDTDMVGPNGYLADISRTLHCPGWPVTAEQRRLYDIAQDQLLTNIELIRPGMTYRQFGERAWPVPDEFLPNRYMLMVHGVGMVDETPAITYAVDFADWGSDGRIAEGMLLSVESYIGEMGGREGVKLEEQVLVTASGGVPMSRSPLIDALEG